MDYGIRLRAIGWFFGRLTRRDVAAPVRRRVAREYAAILRRAKPMSQDSLVTSYAMGAYFIAMNRHTDLTAEENYLAIEHGFEASWLIRRAAGSVGGSYLSPSKTKGRLKNAAESHRFKARTTGCSTSWSRTAPSTSGSTTRHAASAACAQTRATPSSCPTSAAWTTPWPR